MSSSHLPTPDLDEIKTWDEIKVFEHFQHLALRLKPEYAAIFRDQEIDGTSLILLTKEDLSGPLFRMPAGPAVKIMNEIARLQGRSVAISPSAADPRIKKAVSEIDDLRQKIELVTRKMESNKKERALLRKERKKLREAEWKLLNIVKEQLGGQYPIMTSHMETLMNVGGDIINVKEHIKDDSEVDSRDIFSNLGELHKKVDNLPDVMLSLYEDTIPRLFFIFPENDDKWWELSADDLFNQKFRIFFICEHETIKDGKVVKQFHLTQHGGYAIANPHLFVAKFGPYIHNIMPCLLLAMKMGEDTLASLPTFGKSAAVIARTGSEIGTVAYKATNSPIFSEIYVKVDEILQQNLDDYGTNNPSSVQKHGRSGPLARPDLRELDGFIQNIDNKNHLGDLQRVLRQGKNGKVIRWVCKTHVSNWESKTAVETLLRVVNSSDIDGCIEFDDNTWVLKMTGLSNVSFGTFYNSVTRVLTSVPLRKISIEDCAEAQSQDVESLINAATTIEILILKNLPNIWITKIAPKCRRLRELHLSGNHIGDEGAHALADFLSTTLTKLDLSKNEIGPKGGCALGEALKQNTVMTTLDLSSNKIGNDGGSAFGEYLRLNTTLTKLNLGSNRIDSTGGRALGESLMQNTTLTTLDLSNNNIGNDGGRALGESLKQNTALTTLDLSSNGIGNDGACALGESLKQNTTLVTLNLSKNFIDKEGQQALVESLKQNTTRELSPFCLLMKDCRASQAEYLSNFFQSLLKSKEAHDVSPPILSLGESLPNSDPPMNAPALRLPNSGHSTGGGTS